MAKRLISLTWVDMQNEMSIAGSPEKIAKLGEDLIDLIARSININSISEVENTQFALQRVIAELKLWEKMQRDRQHLKIKAGTG
jgi:hypothetical protein